MQKSTKNLSVVVILLIFCFFSCKESKKEEHLLQLAQACMESNPEKSSAYLSEVGKMEGVVLSNRALYALLWTQASHKCRRLSGNDSLINTAVEYFTNTGQDELAAMSLLYKGLIHKQNKEVEHAAKAFVMSEQCFEGIENDRYKALLFNHHASLLKKQRLFRKALEYYKRSYMHEMEGDSIHYIVSACNEIALMYRVLGEPDSARASAKTNNLHAVSAWTG